MSEGSVGELLLMQKGKGKENRKFTALTGMEVRKDELQEHSQFSRCCM